MRPELPSRTHEEVHSTPKTLFAFSNSHRQESREYVWEWSQRMWDNGGGNIKLDLAFGL